MCRSEPRKPAAAPTTADVAMKPRVLDQSGDPFATDVGCFRRQLASFPELDAGRFTVIANIAEGIAGDVIRCRDECRGTVAVKKVRNKHLQGLEGTEVNERSMHLGLSSRRAPSQEDPSTEIGILMYLKEQTDLPLYVLKLHNVFADGYGYNGHTWVVTEDCEGGELFQLVKTTGPLGVERTKRYLYQLLQAVRYLHAKDVAHRDISLENVLLKKDTVRLMDFGQAVRSRSTTGLPLRYFRNVCKEFYRSPEAWVPSATHVSVTVPEGAKPGEIVQAAARAGSGAVLVEVRLPLGCVPGRPCRAEVVGYEACPLDVHAVGICAFIMLFGNPVFSTATRGDQSFAFVEACGLRELMVHWGVPLPSEEGVELLESMLRINPTERWTVERALCSGWLNEAREPFVPCHSALTASDAVMTFAVMGA